MELLDLNGDVLPLILDQIYGTSALNAALTCKQIYELAIHRVAAVISCRDAEQLHPLHRYLCGNNRRAQDVEELTLGFQSNQFYVGVMLVDTVDVETDFEDAWLVAEILEQACNLRKLAVLKLQALIEHNPRILPAICSLRRLTSFVTEDIDTDSLRELKESSFVGLRNLDLNFEYRVVTLNSLVELLSCFPNLHTVALVRPTVKSPVNGPDHISDADPESSHGSFLSIRELRLAVASPNTLHLACFCPNMTTLHIVLNHRYILDDFVPLECERSRSLRSLHLCGNQELEYLAPLLPSSIHHIELADPVGVDLSHIRTASLVRVEKTFREMSPVSATLYATPGLAPTSFWFAAANAAPRLRVLTLYSSPEPNHDIFPDWVNNLPDQLSYMRLVALTVYMPSLYQTPSYTLSEWRKKKYFNTLYTCADVLPQRLADAIPTLRFFTLVGPRMPTAGERDSRATAAMTTTARAVVHNPVIDGIPEVPVDLDAFEHDLQVPGPYTPARTVVRGWRVVHDGDARRLERMTNREMRHVADFVAYASFEELECAYGDSL
ncbi:hypothetical protein C8Q80DRAFT_1269156 [Daedaleopsis nitida]|nr:hypothetical protein C8Q80DRAFT_1269156 [Daedaleopsis nitida]